MGLIGLALLLAMQPVQVAEVAVPANVTAYAAPARAVVYDIPLTAEKQQFVQSLAARYDLSFELCLAVMAVESNFDCRASSGSSCGIMQLNSNTYPTLARDLGIEKFDPYDFYHNVQAGIYKLALEREYWLGEDLMDEDAVQAMLISYNRGRAGARRYIEKCGLSAEYVEKVLAYKGELERGEHDGNGGRLDAGL